jgi:hypothetical protein
LPAEPALNQTSPAVKLVATSLPPRRRNWLPGVLVRSFGWYAAEREKRVGGYPRRKNRLYAFPAVNAFMVWCAG